MVLRHIKPSIVAGLNASISRLHVLVELVVVPEIGDETRDGQIGQGVKIVKHDAEMFLQLAFVIGLQLGLRAG